MLRSIGYMKPWIAAKQPPWISAIRLTIALDTINDVTYVDDVGAATLWRGSEVQRQFPSVAGEGGKPCGDTPGHPRMHTGPRAILYPEGAPSAKSDSAEPLPRWVESPPLPLGMSSSGKTRDSKPRYRRSIRRIPAIVLVKWWCGRMAMLSPAKRAIPVRFGTPPPFRIERLLGRLSTKNPAEISPGGKFHAVLPVTGDFYHIRKRNLGQW